MWCMINNKHLEEQFQFPISQCVCKDGVILGGQSDQHCCYKEHSKGSCKCRIFFQQQFLLILRGIPKKKNMCSIHGGLWRKTNSNSYFKIFPQNRN